MENLIEKYADRLPQSYLEFISTNISFEDHLGEEFGYVSIWNINELYDAWEGYEFPDHLGDEWFPVGSNRGGEIIAIKISSPARGLFYIPFIPMSAE